MYKEIGSNFWCDTTKIKNLESEFKIYFNNIKYTDSAFLWTGRSAIVFVLNDIKKGPKRVLLPAYTCCHTVIKTFLKRGYEIDYYNINNKLEIDTEDFERTALKTKPTVALFHSYFGFDTLSSTNKQINKLKEEGTIIIEDITQSLFSVTNHIDADYYIGSFRKWLAIPDGGVALKVNGMFNNKPKIENKEQVSCKLEAFHNKYLYMENNAGDKSIFLNLFKKAKELIDESDEIYSISKESQFILNNINVNELAQKRRDNYIYLLDNLKEIEQISVIFNKLPKDEVPLYFPILIKSGRAEMQVYLAQNHIYAPVIWPFGDEIRVISKNTQEIYDQILAIPCDQRYSIDEMKKIVDVILEFLT